MKLFFKVNIFLIFSLFLFACDKPQTKVNYQKPYLDITYKDDNQPLAIKMVDYQSKKSINIDAHNFSVLMPSYLNPYNNDYLLTSRFNCEILVVNKDGSSHLFNPCQQVDLKGDANINDGVYYNEKYLVVTFNIGFNKYQKNYDYALGIFNHDYQLVDFLEFDQQPYLFNLENDQLYFTSMSSLYSGFDLINEYNIKSKKLKQTKTKFKDIKDMFVINNNIYLLNENCQLYLNDRLLVKVSERCANIQNKYLYQKDNKIIYNLLAFSQDSDQPNDIYLEISKNNPYKVKVVKDLLCLANNAWYSPEGKYCLNKDNQIIFNDFQGKIKLLDIIKSNGKHQEYGFFNWE